VHDETKIVAENVEIVVQINSKIKARLSMTVDSSEAEITAEALKNDKISELLQGKKPHKVIFVKNKLVNLLV
jgi:leucyl-tRNA synthetase